VTELARGGVADRPWGLTLGALGMRGLTGQLTLISDGKRYHVAFQGGAVVAAASPLASDAVVRLAMTGGLLSSSQVADIARRHQANPQRDEVELIAELIRLSPDQAMKLRRRAVAQRAARTFSLDRGDFVVDDQVTLPIYPGAELDVRAVIFLGAKTNLSEQRLASELATFGGFFKLREEAVVDLPQYGFAHTEDTVLDLLEAGAALGDLERVGSEVHVVRAMVYALMSCNALDGSGAPRSQARPARPAAQQPQARPVATGRPMRAETDSDPVDLPTFRRDLDAVGTVDGTYKRSFDHGETMRRPANLDAPTTPRVMVSRPKPVAHTDPAQAGEVKALIKRHLELLRKRADHYALLGTHIDATPDEIRKAYFALARQLHPDRLSALDISDDTKEAQRLFAEVNTAFGILSDPVRRKDYTNVLRRGGEAAVAAEQARAEEMAIRILDAEEAFRRGEAALRRDQLASALQEFARALQLNPDEVDYVAAHSWAEFCASPDKVQIAQKTRNTLERAIAKSPRSVTPRFYAGRVERMLGRDADALRHFHDVLQIEPHHREATTEARVIEQRLAGPVKKR
jgi:tetratricopeptide (TPR) repeat protein